MKTNGPMTMAAVAVFALAFGGAFALSEWGPSLGQSLAGMTTPAVGASVTFGPVASKPGSTFQKVRSSAVNPAAAERADRLRQIEQAEGTARTFNVVISDSAVEAAYNDAPSAPGYAAYATRDRALSYTDLDAAENLPREAKIACVAYRNTDTKQTQHWIVRYSDTHMAMDDTARLADWVVAGCAQTVNETGTTLSLPHLMSTIADLMPNTPEYAEQRRKWLASVVTYTAKHPG